MKSPRPSKVQPKEEYKKREANRKQCKKRVETLKRIRVKLGIKHTLDSPRNNTSMQVGPSTDPSIESSAFDDNIMQDGIVTPDAELFKSHGMEDNTEDLTNSLQVTEQAGMENGSPAQCSSNLQIYTT